MDQVLAARIPRRGWHARRRAGSRRQDPRQRSRIPGATSASTLKSHTASYNVSALLTARGAPPPLALARRLRASLAPQALSALLTARGASVRLGPHPQALPSRAFALNGG